MEERITGVMIYYYFVCRRKLWYFCHEINMESENEDVQIGKLLDESSYERSEKHIQINGEINIDFIKDHQELHEIKKSKSIEQAGIWQVKYYLRRQITKTNTINELMGVVVILSFKPHQLRRQIEFVRAIGLSMKYIKKGSFRC